jgi:tRNA pseudouridine13 synthase
MEFEKLSHLSCIKGSGGEKGNRPEDFVVDEITELGYVSELTKKQIQEENGEYVIFAVKKTNITTSDMIKIISQKLKINAERITVAGQKDKNAVTYQLACCWKGKEINKEIIMKLKSIKTKDGTIEIIKAWNSVNSINIGDLIGNKFKIRLENVKNIEQISKIYESNKEMVPNYFWKQRFGINQKNIVVAKHILLKEYEEAIIEMMTDNKEDKEMIKEIGIKNFIMNKKDVKGEYENIIKKQLMKSNQVGKTECLSAIKMIPVTILKMIIESYQSYLFNLELSESIKSFRL